MFGSPRIEFATWSKLQSYHLIVSDYHLYNLSITNVVLPFEIPVGLDKNDTVTQTINSFVAIHVQSWVTLDSPSLTYFYDPYTPYFVTPSHYFCDPRSLILVTPYFGDTSLSLIFAFFPFIYFSVKINSSTGFV